MPNNRYLAGRRMEWERRKHWESAGCQVIRSAGSKSPWDLVAICPTCVRPVLLIQCKRARTEAQAQRMLEAFKKKPPLPASKGYFQVMEAWVPRKGVFTVCSDD